MCSIPWSSITKTLKIYFKTWDFKTFLAAESFTQTKSYIVVQQINQKKAVAFMESRNKGPEPHPMATLRNLGLCRAHVLK